MKKQCRNKKRIIAFVIIITIILLSVFIGYKTSFSGETITPSKNPGLTKPVSITKDNLPVYLQNNQMIKELPKDAVIFLRFYNFNTGERQWEESYIITKSKVQEGQSQNPDLEIWLHSKYIPQSYNICDVVKNAKSNGDFAVDLKLSKTQFLWKYKNMLEYRDCFGS